MTISENSFYEKVIEDCNSLRAICNNLWPQLYELLKRNEHKYFSLNILANMNAITRSYEQEKIEISFRKRIINQGEASYYIEFRNENSHFKIHLFTIKEDVIDFVYVPIQLKLYNTKEVMKKIQEIKEFEILKEEYSFSGLSNCF